MSYEQGFSDALQAVLIFMEEKETTLEGLHKEVYEMLKKIFKKRLEDFII